ncbi:MAG: prophage regulatory protein [Granulosicoccus sp.]|jgi:prophage regulatory protein
MTSSIIRLIRSKQAQSKMSLPKTSFYQQIKQGFLVKPFSLGGRSVAFLEHEIDAIINARAAGQTDDEVKALVVELELQRKQYRELRA